MKRVCFVLSLWLFSVAIPAWAQVSTEAELNRLEDLRYESMMNADLKTMDQIFADDFVYQTLLGSTHSKSSYFPQFTSGDVKIYSFKRENSRVKFYGNTATVMAVAHLDVAFKGERRQLSLNYLNVWVQRDGRWQLVARQSTGLPKK
ncbi:MAG: nuclear transport factor 2 family protein [Burkholderiales bacterium]